MLKLPVKIGILTLDKQMTRKQAERYGKRNMPADLRRVGFRCFVGESDEQMHGGKWFRISYGYNGKRGD